MKKKKKKTKKIKTKKRIIKKKKIRKSRNIRPSKRKKKLINSKKKKIKKTKVKNSSKNLILKIIRFQDKLTPSFKFDFSLDRAIQGFFQKIANKIDEYKAIKAKEN